jgi:flagellar motor protein MotB
LLRPRRETNRDEGSWAISYADFLMVLLTFFIFFYSDQSKNTLARVINEITSGSGTLSPAKFISRPEQASTGVLQQVSAIVRESSYATDHNGKGYLLIEMPQNIYSVGGYQPPAVVQTVLEKLRKFDGKLEIEIQGHADAVPFRAGSENRVINTNLNLSAYRAVLLTQHFQSQMPNTRFSIKASDQSQKSRTFSLIIREDSSGGSP